VKPLPAGIQRLSSHFLANRSRGDTLGSEGRSTQVVRFVIPVWFLGVLALSAPFHPKRKYLPQMNADKHR
jgi:hypothetical protein